MRILAHDLWRRQVANPFSNPQSREYSDSKVIGEFQPTSIFWDLFNEQHELIIGSRGSGKTFLLKMMRYSMLEKCDNPKAQSLIKQKEFIALYVPMKLSFVSYFSSESYPDKTRLEYFYFSFNCLLAESLINELISLSDEYTGEKSFIINNKLAQRLNECWFNNEDGISSLIELQKKVRQYHFKFKIDSDLSEVIPLFTSDLGSTLYVVKQDIFDILELPSKPKWIICIDEAEFLSELFQKAINSTFRGSTDGLIYKVATLPFSHRTYKTLEDSVDVSVGNDFSIKHIDMKYNSSDFVLITNKLCTNRLGHLFEDIDKFTLEDFVGKVGSDRMVDYYCKEINFKGDIREHVETGITEMLSPERVERLENLYGEKKLFVGNVRLRKQLFDKLAPIYYLREMYKLNRTGKKIPGWYAGGDFIRKASQGNPRMFLIIMNALFEKCRKKKLTEKQQHLVIYRFAKDMCESTKSLIGNGPESMKNLNNIATFLKKRTHKKYLGNAGNTFSLDISESKLVDNLKWIQESVAHNRLLVDDTSLLYGITVDTRYTLSNFYSIYYWIPIRKYNYPQIPIIDKKNKNSYDVFGYKRKSNTGQLSFFEEDDDDV